MKNEYKNLNIKEIITKAQKNDKDALEELIRREQKNVYASFYYLNPDCEDILDLTQDVLFKMAKNIKSLRRPENFKSWLNQIITNRFFDELRKKKRKPTTVSMDQETTHTCVPDCKPMPEEKTLKRELDSIIRDSIHKLPEPFRIAIVMRELAGLSYEEIASITKCNIGTVKSRIARARNKLQEYIKPYIA